MNQTVLVHYCFKQHLGEKQPENCRCRKWITYQEAEQKVAEGRADWLILSRTKVKPEETSKYSAERGRFNPALDTLDQKNFTRTCPVCEKYDEAKKARCKNCHGRGCEQPDIYWEELSRHQQPYPGGAIVMVGKADEKGRFNNPLAKKTPRVATLEGPNPNSGPQRLGHIVRAVVVGKKYDQDRIEEYGRVNKLELYGQPQGAPLEQKTNAKTAVRVGDYGDYGDKNEKIGNMIVLKPEPKNSPGKWNKVTKKWDQADAQGRDYDYGRAIV